MPRAPKLSFDEADFKLAREYVVAQSEIAFGVKLQVKPDTNMLENPASGSTYSIFISPDGEERNALAVAVSLSTGQLLYGGPSTWCGILDVDTSRLYLIGMAELMAYAAKALAHGGTFQGLRIDNETQGYSFLAFNMGWADGAGLIKKVIKLDKDDETFAYFRGDKLKTAENFAHLHCHSYYSMLDGVSSPMQLAETMYLNGQPGGALTDHGNMMGAYKFWKACNEYGIKPAMGCEVYTVDDTSRKSIDKDGNARRFEYHQTLIAMNQTGWENLCELVSNGSKDHFYYVMRVSHADIFKHKEGIICLSGCFKGMVAHHLQYHPPEKTLECPWYSFNPGWSRQVMATYKQEFGDRYYAEVQSNNFLRYMDALPRICQLADDLGVPKVITNDAHFTVPEDAVLQKLMTRINSNREEELGEGSDQVPPYYLKCRDEIIHPLFTPDMYDRTVEILNRCDVSFKNTSYLFPKYNLQEDCDWLEYAQQTGIK